MLIKHAVRLEALEDKQLIDAYNLAAIKKHPESWSYYQECQAELEAMKGKNVIDSCSYVSYFAVLADPVEIVAGDVKDQELVQAFESNYKSAFPIYHAELRKKFDEAKESIDD